MSVYEYYKLLERHDFTYEYIDNGRQYRTAKARDQYVRSLYAGNPSLEKLYSAFNAYAHNRADKPQLDNYL